MARLIHVIGAGGSGMSAIATVLVGMGHRVSGSDAADSVALRRLGDLGAEVHVGHDAKWVERADVVVRSTAVPDDNPEVVEARRRGLRVWRRAEMLASLCAAKRTVGVSGTHGKTTTSSLLALILTEAGRHPSMIIGGEIAGIGAGARWDSAGEWFVVEADESDGTFLELGAEAVVVTSVEPDHLDFYGSEAAMRHAYARYVAVAKGPGVVSADDPGCVELTRQIGKRRPLVTYGTSTTADVRIVEPITTRTGATFSVVASDCSGADVSIAVPGLHNVRNATAAMAMAHELGVGWDQAARAVGAFRGVGRRFERRGEREGVTFIDDYGHLPTEVRSMVVAASSGGWDRMVVVFQPHRYSRTEALWPDFADSFEGADVLILADVYPAGEPSRPGVTGRLIFDAVVARHPDSDVRYCPTLDDVEAMLRAELRPGDLCLTLGAGDLTTMASRMLAGPPW
jgi:UDP-N-acetylmuramate--alanine ligase